MSNLIGIMKTRFDFEVFRAEVKVTWACKRKCMFCEHLYTPFKKLIMFSPSSVHDIVMSDVNAFKNAL